MIEKPKPSFGHQIEQQQFDETHTRKEDEDVTFKPFEFKSKEAEERHRRAGGIIFADMKSADPRMHLNLPSVSDGSTASYYELPKGCKELQDLISYRNMNAQMGEIFRATYRYGLASHSDQLRDAKKILFYIKAEIKRLEQLK